MIRTGLITSAITLTIMAGISIWAGSQLPADNIPVHWNGEGVADRYSDKNEALLLLWMMPGSAALTALIFALLPKIEPMRDNLFKSRKAYTAIWISILLLFLGIQGGIAFMMVAGSGEEVQSNEFVRFISAFIVNGIGLVFVVTGAALGTALISAVYSFIVYRSAPDKRVSPDYIV